MFLMGIKELRSLAHLENDIVAMSLYNNVAAFKLRQRYHSIHSSVVCITMGLCTDPFERCDTIAPEPGHCCFR